MKGALLKDKKGILIQQTENVQAGRHVRFTNVRQSRQRAYLLYFTAPKQSKTRESRVEKSMQQILKEKEYMINKTIFPISAKYAFAFME